MGKCDFYICYCWCSGKESDCQCRRRKRHSFYPSVRLGELQQELQPDSLDVHDQIAIVAAVGRKMRGKPGITGKLFAALGEAGINIRVINQGPDELNVVLGVDNREFAHAIRVLYHSFTK